MRLSMFKSCCWNYLDYPSLFGLIGESVSLICLFQEWSLLEWTAKFCIEFMFLFSLFFSKKQLTDFSLSSWEIQRNRCRGSLIIVVFLVVTQWKVMGITKVLPFKVAIGSTASKDRLSYRWLSLVFHQWTLIMSGLSTCDKLLVSTCIYNRPT